MSDTTYEDGLRKAGREWQRASDSEAVKRVARNEAIRAASSGGMSYRRISQVLYSAGVEVNFQRVGQVVTGEDD